MESTAEGLLRYLRRPSAFDRNRKLPAGRVPPRQRQPDGTLPALPHAPPKRRRKHEDGLASAGDSSARRDRVSRLGCAVGARRIPRAVSPSRQSLHPPLAFLAAGAVVAGGPT